MFLQRIQEGLRFTAFLLLCLPALSTMAASGDNDPPPKDIRNIVLVHGAFADGSGYKALFNILTAKGYHVTVVQNPLTSLKDDVAATRNILDKQDGPCVLVGHSWGGTVITEAGTHPKVAALVYIAAFQPDKGENTAQLAGSRPATDPSGILPPDDKGVIYFDVAQFHDGFSADLPIETSNFMAASQVPIFAACFGTPVSQVGWKNKPSYGIVATDDHALHPDIQRRMYKRAGDHITEIKGSQFLFPSLKRWQMLSSQQHIHNNSFIKRSIYMQTTNTTARILYTGKTRTTGGREGKAISTDGQLDISLGTPGSGKGTNPEQLFAAGWSACFIGAMGLAAHALKIKLPEQTAVNAEIDLVLNDGQYSLQARLYVALPGLDATLAQQLIDSAHANCPYSKATRSNIPVSISLV